MRSFDDPFKRRPGRARGLRVASLKLREGLSPFSDNPPGGKGSNTAAGHRDQALIGFTSPAATGNHGTRVENRADHAPRSLRCLLLDSLSRARRFAWMIASNSALVVSRSQAPAWAFSSAATSLSIRRFSQSLTASRTTSLVETNCPEST